LTSNGSLRKGARVGVLGLAFKENVRDLRNSRVPDIVRELQSYGITVMVHDPLADPDHARHEYALELCRREDLQDLDALVLAVPHRVLLEDLPKLWPRLLPNGVVIDIKSVIDAATLPHGVRYWSL
jgi:UDP-N-acetyl-D-galactosamine dehydrogenase